MNSSECNVKKVAVIGAGFCGTAVTVQLLTRARRPLEIWLVNRGETMGRGAAYGTRSPHHLLNVPAGRMGMLPSDEGGFLRFLHSHVSSEIHASDFVGRHLYGQYLEEMLNTAAFSAGKGVSLIRRQDEALSLEQEGHGYRVAFSSGKQAYFDQAILALGHQPPSTPHGLDELSTTLRYLADPWAHDLAARVPRDQPVAFMGTGLTMVDALLQLHRWGHPGPYWAISPRGLLPLPHRGLDEPPPPVDMSAIREQHSARALMKSLRAITERHEADGGDWRDVLAAIRSITTAIWGVLPDTERSRFLRHAKRYWEVHRHRLAPSTAQVIQGLIDRGRLKVVPGRVSRAKVVRDRIVVHVSSGKRPQYLHLSAGALINCTGPNTRLQETTNPLLKTLLAHGMIRHDSLSIGIDLDGNYHPLDTQGIPLDGLYYLGPMLQARYWEATAVPELREHAGRLAGIVSGQLDAMSAREGKSGCRTSP